MIDIYAFELSREHSQMVANAKGLLTKRGVQLITKNNKDCLGRDSEPKKP